MGALAFRVVNTSGLIYAAIVVLWAVVLVPMWLRRHDEVTESRSVDRFQGAMRTLSRRGAEGLSSVGDRREVIVPRREATKTVPDGAIEPPSPASLAAARRRLVGLVLIGLTVLVVGLGLMGVLPLWASLVPVLLLVLFVVRARASARAVRDRELAQRRSRAAQSRRLRHEQAARTMGRPAAAAEAARQAAAASARRAERAAIEAAEDERRRDAADRAGAAAYAASALADPEFYDAVAERAWEPVPVPLPTYVSAPKAPRSVRIIDLSVPGAWTSARLVDSPLDEHEEHASDDAAAERDPIVTGEVLVERRRAVGD